MSLAWIVDREVWLSFQVCHRGEPAIYAESLRRQPSTVVWVSLQEVHEAGIHEWRYSTLPHKASSICHFLHIIVRNRGDS